MMKCKNCSLCYEQSPFWGGLDRYYGIYYCPLKRGKTELQQDCLFNWWKRLLYRIGL